MESVIAARAEPASAADAARKRVVFLNMVMMYFFTRSYL